MQNSRMVNVPPTRSMSPMSSSVLSTKKGGLCKSRKGERKITVDGRGSLGRQLQVGFP